jgi:hypothetical protein
MNDNQVPTKQFVPRINSRPFQDGHPRDRVHPPRPTQIMPGKNKKLNQTHRSEIRDLQ